MRYIHKKYIYGENKNMNYLVNTNEKYEQGATDYNILKREVIIYGSIKDSINTLKEGDGIFLYKKGVGIIAFGIIDNDNITIRDWGDDKMYSKDLCKFIDFSDNPIKYMAQGGKLIRTIAQLNETDLQQIREKLF